MIRPHMPLLGDAVWGDKRVRVTQVDKEKAPTNSRGSISISETGSGSSDKTYQQEQDDRPDGGGYDVADRGLRIEVEIGR